MQKTLSTVTLLLEISCFARPFSCIWQILACLDSFQMMIQLRKQQIILDPSDGWHPSRSSAFITPRHPTSTCTACLSTKCCAGVRRSLPLKMCWMWPTLCRQGSGHPFRQIYLHPSFVCLNLVGQRNLLNE